uniref:Uncharacterized protein n=1 Tax=Schistocephalus solidus TaxID=70667 RepID=A0A0V0J8Q6_SCHSO
MSLLSTSPTRSFRVLNPRFSSTFASPPSTAPTSKSKVIPPANPNAEVNTRQTDHRDPSSSVHGRYSCGCSSGKVNSEGKTTPPRTSALPSSTGHGEANPGKQK